MGVASSTWCLVGEHGNGSCMIPIRAPLAPGNHVSQDGELRAGGCSGPKVVVEVLNEGFLNHGSTLTHSQNLAPS